MNRQTILSGLLILACTVGPIAASLAYEAYRTRDLTAEILARAPEKGNFSPQVVRVLAGKKVKLRVRHVPTEVMTGQGPLFENEETQWAGTP